MALFKNVNSELYPVTNEKKEVANAVAMSPDQEGKKWPLNNKTIMAAFFGLVVIATLSGCTSSSAEKKTNTTTATAPVSPTKTPENNTAETIPTVESLEINASLMNDPEALIKKFIENHNKWVNNGATMENAKAALASHDVLPYAQKTGAESDDIFIKAQYIDNWESTPILVENIKRSIATHAATLTCNYCTSFPKIISKDQIPYKREMTFVNIVSTTKDGQSITIKFTEKEVDNSDDNRVGEELTPPLIVKNVESQPTLTFTNVNGKMKISDIVFGEIKVEQK